MKKKRDQAAFDLSKKQVDGLILKEKTGEIDLYYFDESGFSLTPCVPYAWQAKGETIELPSSRSKQINVVGFLSRSCQFQSFVFEQSITAEVVVACINEFVKTLTRPTTLLIDNAPTHTSHFFLEHIEAWKAQGLDIVNISAYSPELNRIEILWKRIKYDWLPFSAYESYQSLKDSLFHVLANVGQEYKLKFS